MAIINVDEKIRLIQKMGLTELAEYKRKVFLSSCSGDVKKQLIEACELRYKQIGEHSPLVEHSELDDIEEEL